MSCSCNNPDVINSWIDWRNQAPRDPLELIARAKFGGSVGAYADSPTFHTYSGAIVASPFVYTGTQHAPLSERTACSAWLMRTSGTSPT